MLPATLEHYRAQQEITAAGVTDARSALLRRGSSYAADVVAAYQILAAQDAAASVGAILEDQNIIADQAADVRPESVAGTASDGRSLVGLIDQAQTDQQFGLIVATQLQDVARSAFGLGMAVRPTVEGYVRVLNPPACSRCAVLAGKFFRWNTGFQRHPRCDCRHEPTTRADWRDLVGSHDPTSNPDAYFHSLPTAEDLSAKYPNLTVKARNEAGIYSREDIFTKAGARAIEDGADMGQIVNARRGMAKAQVFGHDVWRTLEGTTRRGVAYSRLRDLRTNDRRTRGERYLRTTNVRIMPETIYELAKDRTDAIRLLKLNGFIF